MHGKGLTGKTVLPAQIMTVVVVAYERKQY